MADVDDLAKQLSDPKRIGLDAELIKALSIPDEQTARAHVGSGHRAVHLLGAYVENDTDAFGKGEVYWWALPMLGDASGKISWNPLCGLPTGAPPETVGSHEWMNLSLAEPPLLLVIPPSSDVVAGYVHLAFFDDDWEPAKLPPAIAAGLRALAAVSFPAADPPAVIAPIRAAIQDALLSKRDDLMLERTLRFARDEGKGYGAGTISSATTEYMRAYWLVRDVGRTETCGPWSLAKGQQQRVLPAAGLHGGGTLAIFARGGTVDASPFGVLNTETPFVNVAIERRHEAALAGGLTITAETDADVVAFYTPPST